MKKFLEILIVKLILNIIVSAFTFFIFPYDFIDILFHVTVEWSL
jgi:hypothetical protein